MVGAGGIGCELLKTLVLTGFKHIHLVSCAVCSLRPFLLIIRFLNMLSEQSLLGILCDSWPFIKRM